ALRQPGRRHVLQIRRHVGELVDRREMAVHVDQSHRFLLRLPGPANGVIIGRCPRRARIAPGLYCGRATQHLERWRTSWRLTRRSRPDVVARPTTTLARAARVRM